MTITPGPTIGHIAGYTIYGHLNINGRQLSEHLDVKLIRYSLIVRFFR
jgi:hypothetical protein